MEAVADPWRKGLGVRHHWSKEGHNAWKPSWTRETSGRVLFEIEPENSRNYVALASVYVGGGWFAEAESVLREMVERGMKRM
ncbi:Pentatricopeptide repeat-containing protein [Acorus calamus]|uniref:Pentatricopeptide repeat-containing protein n=1 Tax=Acorus calamus TaxID=4465 RepID=A0AAV9EBG5_ACOCL|nr:Pentatricopeptide repeat-containing protein [Acorus calamus]